MVIIERFVVPYVILLCLCFIDPTDRFFMVMNLSPTCSKRRYGYHLMSNVSEEYPTPSVVLVKRLEVSAERKSSNSPQEAP